MSNAASLFGTCWGTPNGQDLSSPSYMASGNQIVAEAILRRWSTTKGDLIDDRNYGEDLTDLISDDLSPADIAYKQQQLAAEAAKDERVFSASVTLTLVAGVLMCAGAIETQTGPFKMVVSVTNVSVSLLLVSP